MLVHIPIIYINAIHVLFQGLVLALIGFYKNKTPKWIYYFLILLTLSILILVPLPNLSTDYWSLIKWFHYIILLPVLLYVSYIGIYFKFSNQAYDFMLWIGIFVIVYHAYKIYKRINDKKKKK